MWVRVIWDVFEISLSLLILIFPFRDVIVWFLGPQSLQHLIILFFDLDDLSFTLFKVEWFSWPRPWWSRWVRPCWAHSWIFTLTYGRFIVSVTQIPIGHYYWSTWNYMRVNTSKLFTFRDFRFLCHNGSHLFEQNSILTLDFGISLCIK